MTKLDRDFDLSRDPSEYEASIHVLQQMRDRTLLDTKVIEDIIREGEVVEVNENHDDGKTNVVLRDDWLNATFEVVVGVEDNVVETGYEVK